VSGSERSSEEKIVLLKNEIVKRDEQLKEKSLRMEELEASKKELSFAVEAANREKEFMQKMVDSYKNQPDDSKAVTTDKSEALQKEYEQKISFLKAEIKGLEEKLGVKEQ
jgi:beta-glucosidase-like glycosyl hydrolase